MDSTNVDKANILTSLSETSVLNKNCLKEKCRDEICPNHPERAFTLDKKWSNPLTVKWGKTEAKRWLKPSRSAIN